MSLFQRLMRKARIKGYTKRDGTYVQPHQDSRASAAQRIASGEGWDFWQIGSEVYRAPVNSGLDTVGHPMGKRWESSREHWDRYRAVFAWAKDEPLAKAAPAEVGERDFGKAFITFEMLREESARSEGRDRPTVCVDFDGTITEDAPHEPGVPSAAPGSSACDLLRRLAARYRVVVLTARPVDEVWPWLWRHGYDQFVADVTNVKPPAIAYLDNRAINVQADEDVDAVLRAVGGMHAAPGMRLFRGMGKAKVDPGKAKQYAVSQANARGLSSSWDWAAQKHAARTQYPKAEKPAKVKATPRAFRVGLGRRKPVKRPGIRGGKFYYDRQGNVLYGVPPVNSIAFATLKEFIAAHHDWSAEHHSKQRIKHVGVATNDKPWDEATPEQQLHGHLAQLHHLMAQHKARVVPMAVKPGKPGRLKQLLAAAAQGQFTVGMLVETRHQGQGRVVSVSKKSVRVALLSGFEADIAPRDLKEFHDAKKKWDAPAEKPKAKASTPAVHNKPELTDRVPMEQHMAAARRIADRKMQTEYRESVIETAPHGTIDQIKVLRAHGWDEISRTPTAIAGLDAAVDAAQVKRDAAARKLEIHHNRVRREQQLLSGLRNPTDSDISEDGGIRTAESYKDHKGRTELEAALAVADQELGRAEAARNSVTHEVNTYKHPTAVGHIVVHPDSMGWEHWLEVGTRPQWEGNDALDLATHVKGLKAPKAEPVMGARAAKPEKRWVKVFNRKTRRDEWVDAAKLPEPKKRKLKPLSEVTRGPWKLPDSIRHAPGLPENAGVSGQEPEYESPGAFAEFTKVPVYPEAPVDRDEIHEAVQSSRLKRAQAQAVPNKVKRKVQLRKGMIMSLFRWRRRKPAELAKSMCAKCGTMHKADEMEKCGTMHKSDTPHPYRATTCKCGTEITEKGAEKCKTCSAQTQRQAVKNSFSKALAKAGLGSRGGHFWYNKHGNVEYGQQPTYGSNWARDNAGLGQKFHNASTFIAAHKHLAGVDHIRLADRHAKQANGFSDRHHMHGALASAHKELAAIKGVQHRDPDMESDVDAHGQVRGSKKRISELLRSAGGSARAAAREHLQPGFAEHLRRRSLDVEASAHPGEAARLAAVRAESMGKAHLVAARAELVRRYTEETAELRKSMTAVPEAQQARVQAAFDVAFETLTAEGMAPHLMDLQPDRVVGLFPIGLKGADVAIAVPYTVAGESVDFLWGSREPVQRAA